MNIKVEIKEEDPLSEEVTSPTETEFFIKTNGDAVLLYSDRDVTEKMAIKSETPVPNFCSQDEGEGFTTSALKSEITDCEINTTKTDIKEEPLISSFGSLNETDFLLENPAMEVKKCNSDNEMDTNIKIEEESWWTETETSSVCVDVKDGNLDSVKSPRSYTEGVYADTIDKSTLPSAEDLGKDATFYMGKNYNDHGHPEAFSCQESYVTQKNVHSDNGSTYDTASCLKQKNLIDEDAKPFNCELCGKRYTALKGLKRHNVIHAGEKPYKCEICDTRFTYLSCLKRHHSVHEGKRPHRCDICEKTFTRLSDLKQHGLIHEGRKPYKCDICGKQFIRLSNLKSHNLIHGGVKRHKCEVCEKRFTRLQHLKRHSLIHELHEDIDYVREIFKV